MKQIPKLAQSGIVEGQFLFGVESGPEIVVPLGKVNEAVTLNAVKKILDIASLAT